MILSGNFWLLLQTCWQNYWHWCLHPALSVQSQCTMNSSRVSRKSDSRVQSLAPSRGPTSTMYLQSPSSINLLLAGEANKHRSGYLATCVSCSTSPFKLALPRLLQQFISQSRVLNYSPISHELIIDGKRRPALAATTVLCLTTWDDDGGSQWHHLSALELLGVGNRRSIKFNFCAIYW